jgi:hypothetical protein
VSGKFFFEASAWKTLEKSISRFDLKMSQRHSNDQEFDIILQNLRLGKCDEDTLKALKQTEGNVFPKNIKPTILYLKNINVDLINQHELQKLVEVGCKVYKYTSEVTQTPAAKAWASSCKIPEFVELCEGAQVMLTWNIDITDGLCNGSRGVVQSANKNGVMVSFTQGPRLISFMTLEHPDNPKACIKYMPLRLAYALTINKCQAMTLDAAIVDMTDTHASREFLYGKYYTAVSRVRDLKSIIIRNPQADLFQAHPDVTKFYETQVI